MRIGVHCFPLKADIGGMKQYFLTLFDELLEHDRENEYVFFHHVRNVDELSGLSSTRWRENAVQLGKASRIANQLKGLDLFFSPFVILPIRPLPIPSVVMIPDNQEMFFPEYFSEQQKFIREWHYRGSARMADRVLTLSEFSKSALVRQYGVRQNKIGVAPLCADPRFFQAEAIAQRPSVFIPERNFLFYPANRWHHKNHDGLLRALRYLSVEKNLQFNLVITGHDIEAGYPLARKASEYGIEDQVFSLGYVTVEELAWLYCNAVMTVFPSFFEGFGLPLVEAMASGSPIAASRGSSIPEVCGDAVELFDPHSTSSIASAIERIYTQPALREALIKRGRDRAAGFSPARLAAAHLQAFREARQDFHTFRYAWNAIVYSRWHTWIMARKDPSKKSASKEQEMS